MENKWQPIEIAPKDGSDILCTDGLEVKTAFWSTNAWVTWNREGSWRALLCWSDSEIICPTHWMPLPKPPKEDL